MKKISTERLDEIITAEDDDRLIILPCKIGCAVYRIKYLCDNSCGGLTCSVCSVHSYVIVKDNFTVSMRDEISKTMFLSEEEAQHKLTSDGYKTVQCCNWYKPRWFKN